MQWTPVVSYLYEKCTGNSKCKILDADLKVKKLDEAMKDFFPHFKPGEVDFQGKTCFGDYEGEPLHLLNEQRPWTRCLSFLSAAGRGGAGK